MGDVTRASVPAASQATALRSEAARRGLALPVEFDVPDHTGRGSGSISSRRAAGTAAGVSCSRIRSMATYVLVHGAWHGGWCWRAVARSLRADGHEVHAPSLTGLGDRRHLAAPDIRSRHSRHGRRPPAGNGGPDGGRPRRPQLRRHGGDRRRRPRPPADPQPRLPGCVRPRGRPDAARLRGARARGQDGGGGPENRLGLTAADVPLGAAGKGAPRLRGGRAR